MTDGKRDYKKQYAHYDGKPKNIKKRDLSNKARNMMVKAGKASKGDGKDVDHRTPMSKGGKTVMSNLRTVSRAANRSFSRNPDGSLKSQRSKRGI